MATLTTAFFHKADHGAKDADEEQRQRFELDGRRFPLNTYKDMHCVRKHKVLRTLNADERERIMGYPTGWTRGYIARGKTKIPLGPAPSEMASISHQ